MLLYYIRHGEPIYDPDMLTELGKRQAEAAAERLAPAGIEKIYASTSNRAIQTARPLCERLGMEPELLDWCHEGHAWDELTLINKRGEKVWAESDPDSLRLFARPEVRALGRKWYAHPAFASTRYAEGMERIQRETDAFLLSLGYRHDLENNCFYEENPQYEKVAIFAHGGTGAAVMSCLLDIPYPMFAPRFSLNHTGIIVVRFQAEEGIVFPRVLTYSETAHLYRDDLAFPW